MAMQDSYGIIKRILEMADTGNFTQAADIAESYCGLSSIYDAVASLLRAEPEGLRLWQSSMEMILSSSGGDGQLLYSSVESHKGEIRFQKVGKGLIRGDGFMEFVTRGEQSIFIENAETIPEGRLWIINLISAFPSNVNDNFYLAVEGDSGSILFRFSNSSFSFCNEGIIVRCNTKVPKLYTLYIGDEYIYFYVNGRLHLKKRRTIRTIKRVKIGLIGAAGADLSGFVYMFDIWRLSSSFSGFLEEEEQLFYRGIYELIERSGLAACIDSLKLIDDVRLEEGLKRRVISELAKESNRRGFREWLFEEVYRLLSPEDRRHLDRESPVRAPEPLLSVEDLTVRFYRFPNRRFSLYNILLKRDKDSFYVLKDINFRLYPGDIIGIIGPNGAGKSTLLKTIAGLIPIESGRVVLRGKHQLLSPGLGVRNELSGRENIYLAACFLGLDRRQVDGIIDEIIEFSELGEFIDQPFKFYSDGMKSRLIFSIATSIAPDILMLDELLSAGDVSFQQKAARRMDELIGRARAVVVVTHNLTFVRQKCNKALFVSKGRVRYYGNPATAVARYLNEQHIDYSKDIFEDITSLHISSLQHIAQQPSLGQPTH